MHGFSTGRYVRLGLRGLRNIIRNKPLTISFEITHNCSANCLHCNWGGDVEETKLSPAEYGEICRELKPVIAHLSGGEPTLRPDINDIAAAIANPNGAPILQIVTHGAKLTNKKYEDLRSAGLDRFCVSLDFPDKRHDEWRKIPGLFDKLSSYLPEIAAHKRDDILVNCCITGANALELPAIVKTADSWGIGLNFSAYTSLRTEDNQYLVNDKELAAGLLESIEEVISLKRNGYRVLTSERILRAYADFLINGKTGKCMSGYRFLVVNPNGRFAPCAMIEKYYRSQSQMVREFSRSNECRECFICTRADTEKTVGSLLKDNLGFFWRSNGRVKGVAIESSDRPTAAAV